MRTSSSRSDAPPVPRVPVARTLPRVVDEGDTAAADRARDARARAGFAEGVGRPEPLPWRATALAIGIAAAHWMLAALWGWRAQH